MATAVRPRDAAHETIGDLVANLSGGPIVVQSNGRAVAVLVDLERYKDMQAIYDWHQQVLQERRAS